MPITPRLSFVVLIVFISQMLHASVRDETSPAPAAEEVVEYADVFLAGHDGYHTYRIPAVLRAANGDLLAFCEGRKQSASDTGDIDLLMKRSTDGGRTWGPTQLIWDDEANTCGNPCPVLDEATGTVWLLATHNPGLDKEADIHAKRATGTRTVWVLSSTNHGATWTRPLDITASTKDPSWGWYATGPGVGIQVQEGPYSGRLVIPCDHSYAVSDGDQRSSGSHAIYSDDHGATWKLGGVIRPAANECQVVELPGSNGTLLMNIRSTRGVNRRLESISTDGGQTWSGAKRATALIEPVCQASILRHPSSSKDGAVLLFSNPHDEARRIRLTVQSSADRGATWQVLHRLHDGPAAYSCLISLGVAGAGCLFECGKERPYEKITFVRFPVERTNSRE